MAEKEQERLPRLFIQPSYYGPIIENFRNKSGMFLVGERGTGKTAVTLDLVSRAKDNSIVAVIDSFSTIEVSYTPVDLYRLIIEAISNQLFNLIFQKSKILSKIDQPKRVLLSYIYKEFTTPTTIAELNRRLQQVQMPLWKRSLRSFYSLIRYPLNFISNVAVRAVTDTVAKSLGNISPNVNEEQIREYFPDIPLRSDDSFLSIKASFNLLTELAKLIQDLGLGSTIVILDRLDEDSRLEGDAEKIANFIKRIVTETNLHSSRNIQFIVSLWSVPFRMLQKNNIRLQKINVELLSWSEENLIKALNQRLDVFSHGNIRNYEALFSEAVTSDLRSKIFYLANGNPRDLWHVMNAILRRQHELDVTATKVSPVAIEEGLKSFVTKFDYYEYYPRKANAKANSLDIYAFIRHLLKLSSPEFTRNQLTERAGVSGGSASNYVNEMENIGLISSVGQTGGATEYKIRDPKIRFALEYSLEISRDAR